MADVTNATMPRILAPQASLDADRLDALAAVGEGLGEALIALDPARLLCGHAALTSAAGALGVRPDPSAVLAAMRAAPQLASPLEALETLGRSFEAQTPTARGPLFVSGAATGALIWIRLRPSPLPDAASSDAGPAGPGSADAAAAFDAHPAPAWVAGADGRPVRVNLAWLEAVGAPDLATALARGASFGRAADEAVAECARRAETRQSTVWLDLPQGRRAVEILAAPLEGGRAAAFALDVTEARAGARAADRERRALELAIAPLADAVALFGPDQRLVLANDAFASLWELDAASLAERPRHGELLDRLRQARLLPETADYAAFKAGELARHADADPGEGVWRLPDGRTVRVATRPHPGGGLIISFSDITAEVRLKAQFNHVVQVQQATLDKLSDAVAVFGADTRLRLHNEAFERMWSIPADALAREPEFDAVVDYCVARLHDLAFWRALKGRIADPDPLARAPAGGEATIGDGRVLAWQSRPLPDGATLVSFADVTDARTLERSVEAQKTALALADRLKSEFVAAVSRELRTPLTTIVGYAELLSRQPRADRAADWLGAVTTAAGRLARSIEDILDIAELDAGEAVLDPGDVDIGELLGRAAQRASAAAGAAGARIIIAGDSAGGLMRADAARLARVLDTLIDNALAQNPAARTITLGAARADGEVVLRVADDGRGIPFHIQARIFERFGGPEAGATGLGLALVKAMIELHGGWVTVESEPGRGAAFSCHLPESTPAPDERPELF
ncbi:MAG TPA: PAS-domain containing protein [Caulobacteraceae bacterium]|jgi:hypothetical protein|nr:PAS-domain containing protein [Caulobacteraceae bacterium]